MPRLSIVITCFNDTDSFETTLASVLQHRPDDCEVVVVHPFAYSDPYDLGGEVRFVDAGSSATGWLELINAGLAATRGEVVHLLQAGLEVEEGWTDRALERFADPRVAAVAPWVVPAQQADQQACAGIGHGRQVRRRVVSGSATAVPRQDILGPSLAAGFYRGEMLRQVGGFDPALGEPLADLDLALTYTELGYRCVSEPASRVRGSLPTAVEAPGYPNGQRNERLFWRHGKSRGGWGSVLIHPLAMACEFLGNLRHGQAVAHLLGRLSACCDLAAGRSYQRRLRRVRSALTPLMETAEDAPAGQSALTPVQCQRLHNRAA